MDRRRFFGALAGTAAVAAAGTYAAEEYRITKTRHGGHLIGDLRPPGLTTTTLVWRANTSRNVAALTFDDGPDPRYTPGVLAALKKYDAKGTFFMQGLHVANYPDLARQVAEDHAIGNHTYYHRNMAVATATEARTELERAHETILRVTRQAPTIFRPPWGHLSGATGMIAAALGYDIIIWSDHIDSKQRVQKNVRRLGGSIRAGSIVLGHDGGNLPNHTVVEVLPGLLTALEERGIQLVTVTELLQIAREETTGNSELVQDAPQAS